MRNLTAVFALTSIATLAGCGALGKKTDDAGVDPAAADAAAAVVAPTTPAGKNAAMIVHVPGEVATNEPKALGQNASPHTQTNGGGTLVSQLKSGTVVTRVATAAGWSLIVFPDPNVPTDMLMGWVSDMAFSAVVIHKTDAGVVVDAGAVAVVDAGPPGLACRPGEALILPGAGQKETCKKTCSVDKDCKVSKACTNANASKGGVVKICAND